MENFNKRKNSLNNFHVSNKSVKEMKIKQCLPLLLKSPDLIVNKLQTPVSVRNNFTGLQFFKYFYEKLIGIHSITEDYFEQEMNNLYCKNGEFIEKGEVI